MAVKPIATQHVINNPCKPLVLIYGMKALAALTQLKSTESSFNLLFHSNWWFQMLHHMIALNFYARGLEKWQLCIQGKTWEAIIWCRFNGFISFVFFTCLQQTGSGAAVLTSGFIQIFKLNSAVSDVLCLRHQINKIKQIRNELLNSSVE